MITITIQETGESHISRQGRVRISKFTKLIMGFSSLPGNNNKFSHRMRWFGNLVFIVYPHEFKTNKYSIVYYIS